MLYSVQETLLIPATIANNSAVVNNSEPVFIFSSQFFDFFVRMGGSGSTLSLILALLFTSKSASSRKFALLALLPAVCNINEPLLFGIPLVLNPIYAVPFVLTPILQTVIAYAAIASEWMPKTAYNTMWTTPPLISGYVVTGSFSGTVVQIVSITVGVALYFPFVRLSEYLAVKRSKRVLTSLLNIAESREASDRKRRYLDLMGEEGRLALVLANDLDRALNNQHEIFLEYQPQIDIRANRIIGAEALLRWEHPQFGRIAPPITIALAEDMGRINQLGYKILEQACRQRLAWEEFVPQVFVMSVNVSPKQLFKSKFDARVLNILKEIGLSPTLLELEITESTALLPDVHAIEALIKLRKQGVKIALDDFGMGHTSLHYLRMLPLDTVKIDRSLTLASQDHVNEHIVKSILDLSRTLNISTIVEGIEHEEQLSRYIALGCEKFQGYYFGRPMPAQNFIHTLKHQISAQTNTSTKLVSRLEYCI